eukprot:GHVU01164399.1.p1 GENE.GHVU01164399.1~~GHVU01164399.1.p1  ORF type:complete len:586 (-),score=5.60 GHVU01164399.1:238-1995(-)
MGQPWRFRPVAGPIGNAMCSIGFTHMVLVVMLLLADAAQEVLVQMDPAFLAALPPYQELFALNMNTVCNILAYFLLWRGMVTIDLPIDVTDRLRLRYEAITILGLGIHRFSRRLMPPIHWWPIPIINPHIILDESLDQYCVICTVFTAMVPCPSCTFNREAATNRVPVILERCPYCTIDAWNGLWCRHRRCQRTILRCAICHRPPVAIAVYHNGCLHNPEWNVRGLYCSREHLMPLCQGCHAPTGTGPCVFCGSTLVLPPFHLRQVATQWMRTWPIVAEELMREFRPFQRTVGHFHEILDEGNFIAQYTNVRMGIIAPIPSPLPAHTRMWTDLQRQEAESVADTRAESAFNLPEEVTRCMEFESQAGWDPDDNRMGELPPIIEEDPDLPAIYNPPAPFAKEWSGIMRKIGGTFKAPPPPRSAANVPLPPLYPMPFSDNPPSLFESSGSRRVSRSRAQDEQSSVSNFPGSKRRRTNVLGTRSVTSSLTRHSMPPPGYPPPPPPRDFMSSSSSQNPYTQHLFSSSSSHTPPPPPPPPSVPIANERPVLSPSPPSLPVVRARPVLSPRAGPASGNLEDPRRIVSMGVG